jgi:hypothetical protein
MHRQNDTSTKYQEATKTKGCMHHGSMEEQFETTAIWTQIKLPMG